MIGVASNATGHPEMNDYTVQMAGFRKSDEARQQLLTEVLEKYEALLREHKTLKGDYVSEQQARRHWQAEATQVTQEVEKTKQALDNSSFVLALIDGDGVIFEKALLEAGQNGGSEAASKLNQAIQKHIAQLYGGYGPSRIIVHIYASLDKLGHKLASCGFVKGPHEFRAFAQAFSVNQSLFTIIDVGQGKERADYKIKEMLRTFVDNPTCKHIIFGGCHDNGYVVNLDQYKHNEATASKITLLETTPAARGFADLPNFRRARFESLFRSEELPNSLPMRPPASKTVSPPPVVPSTAKTPATPIEISPSPGTSTPSASSDNGKGSWAAVGKSGSYNGNIALASNKAPNKTKKYIYFNKDDQRLDEPLPPRERSAVEGLERRVSKGGGRNLCNNWHLSNGKCQNGQFCKFQHEPKLTAAELNALRYKTRSLACKDRYCENFDCYLGHQCPSERDLGYCQYADCNLKSSHRMDKVIYVRVDREGNEEYQ